MKNEKMKFVVRKYIMARSAQEAIRLDKKTPVADVWVDEKYQELQALRMDNVGFNDKGSRKEKS